MFLGDHSAGMELENPGAKRRDDINMEMTGIGNFSEWRV